MEPYICIADVNGEVWVHKDSSSGCLTTNPEVVNNYHKVTNDLLHITEVLLHHWNFTIMKTLHGKILVVTSEHSSGMMLNVCSEPIDKVICQENKIHVLTFCGNVYRVNYHYKDNNFNVLSTELKAQDIKDINICDNIPMYVHECGGIIFDFSISTEPVLYQDRPLWMIRSDYNIEGKPLNIGNYDVVAISWEMLLTETHAYELVLDDDILHFSEGINLPAPMVDMVRITAYLDSDNLDYNSLTDAAMLSEDGSLWCTQFCNLRDENINSIKRIETDKKFKRFVNKTHVHHFNLQHWTSDTYHVEDFDGIVYNLQPFIGDGDGYAMDVKVGTIHPTPTLLSNNEYRPNCKTAKK